MIYRPGIGRIRNYINYVIGKGPKPTMPTELKDFLESGDWQPAIAEVLQNSKSLSENIHKAEQEIQNLDNLLDKLAQCQRENEMLKESQGLVIEESVAGPGKGPTKGPIKGPVRKSKEIGAFDPDSWLKCLTLTQLADLHDKICALTSDLIQRDSSAVPCQGVDRTCPGSLRADYDILNKRIAALQRQIAEKQMEAGRRLQELRRALRMEQANLIRISDEMNRQRKEALDMQLAMDT